MREARTFAPWCAFMHFGVNGPSEVVLTVEPAAAMPAGVTFVLEGDLDPGARDRFEGCLRRFVASESGAYVGTARLRRRLSLLRAAARPRVLAEAETYVAARSDAIAACAPSGAHIEAIRLDVYETEVRLDAVHLPTLDPRYAASPSGASVHDCVSSALTGGHLTTRGRVYPVVTLP